MKHFSYLLPFRWYSLRNIKTDFLKRPFNGNLGWYKKICVSYFDLDYNISKTYQNQNFRVCEVPLKVSDATELLQFSLTTFEKESRNDYNNHEKITRGCLSTPTSSRNFFSSSRNFHQARWMAKAIYYLKMFWSTWIQFHGRRRGWISQHLHISCYFIRKSIEPSSNCNKDFLLKFAVLKKFLRISYWQKYKPCHTA